MSNDIRTRFEAAPTFPEYLGIVEKNAELWAGVYDRVRLPEGAVSRAEAIPGRWHLIALSEDWCGDAVNLLPVVAKWAEAVEGVEFRVLGRDDNPELMDAHLTNGTSRSIPIVIVYDENFEEVGWWGPRPAELQRWVLEEGLAMEKDDRYREVRRWYARDKGRTTLSEIVDLIESAAAAPQGA